VDRSSGITLFAHGVGDFLVDLLPIVQVHGDEDSVADVEEEFVGQIRFASCDMHSDFREIVWVVFPVLCCGVVEVDVEPVVEGDHGFPVSVCVLDGLNVYVSVRVGKWFGLIVSNPNEVRVSSGP